MFDRCRRWRDRLSRYADGTLSATEVDSLRAHLARCPQCRQALEADRAMRAYFRTFRHADPAPTGSFDDQVIRALHSDTDSSSLQGLSVPARYREIPFFLQVAGGSLVAASITLACLLTALRPQRTDPAVAGRIARMQAARNGPPVPLESLLSTPVPRAALLWSPVYSRERPAVTPPSERRIER